MKVTGIRHDDTKEMTKGKQANQPLDQWLIELGMVWTQILLSKAQGYLAITST